MTENGLLRLALDESVKLQSHYAVLLNRYDGGKRMTFESAAAWLDRIKQTKNCCVEDATPENTAS